MRAVQLFVVVALVQLSFAELLHLNWHTMGVRTASSDAFILEDLMDVDDLSTSAHLEVQQPAILPTAVTLVPEADSKASLLEDANGVFTIEAYNTPLFASNTDLFFEAFIGSTGSIASGASYQWAVLNDAGAVLLQTDGRYLGFRVSLSTATHLIVRAKRVADNLEARMRILVTVATDTHLTIWHNGETQWLPPTDRDALIVLAARPAAGWASVVWNIPDSANRLYVGGGTSLICTVRMPIGESTLTVSITGTPITCPGGVSPCPKTHSITFTRSSVAPATRTRSNIYQLNDEAHAQWRHAQRVIKAYGVWDHLTQAHLSVSGKREMNSMATDAHQSPAFLIWHRVFLDVFERSLLASGFPHGIPHWMYHKEKTQSGNVCLWTSALLGERTGTVTMGVPRGWKPLDSLAASLQRAYTAASSATLNTWSSWATNAVASADFANMRTHAENFHNVGHGLIGGMMNAYSSPNDPAFYLVHAMTEQLYFSWQKSKIATTANAYYGTNAQGYPAATTDTLYPWRVRVSGWLPAPSWIAYDMTCSTPMCTNCKNA